MINMKDDAIILDDVTQGVALYKLSSTDRLKTFAVPCNQYRSRNVAFHEGGRTIVTGSDHGSVYIFDRRTGDISDTIHIGFKDWAQSIAVSVYLNIQVHADLRMTDSGSRWCPPRNHWSFRREHREDGAAGMGEG